MPGTAHTWVDGDVATAAFLNALPRGIIARANASVSAQAIGTTTADLTGASVTFTAISGRWYRTIAVCQFIITSGTGMYNMLQITDAANAVQRQAVSMATSTAGASNTLICVHEENAISGSITRKARVQMSSGTATSGTVPGVEQAYITVEEIGV